MTKSKIAIITGASIGIGREIVVALSQKGVFCIMVGRNKNGLQETLRIIEKKKGKGKIFSVDLSKQSEIKSFVSKIKKDYKNVDILVNVVGVWHNDKEAYYGVTFEDHDIQRIQEIFDVGITGTTILTQQLIPLINSGGKIINITGDSSEEEKGWLPYLASKKYLDEFTKLLSVELRNKLIQVNAVSPWYVWTAGVQTFFPDSKDECLQPKYVADLVEFLASSRSDHITGQIFKIKQKTIKN